MIFARALTLAARIRFKIPCCMILLLFTNICFSNSNDSDNSYAAIEKRIAPTGIVDVLGQIKIFMETREDAARPPRGGNEIYHQYCTVCHSTGAAGSPKFGCKSDWAPHIAKGMPVLLQHAQTGFNFMPAKGTCVDCSKGELEDAIHYMVDHSQKDNLACQHKS